MIIFGIACVVFGWWLRSKFQKMFIDPEHNQWRFRP